MTRVPTVTCMAENISSDENTRAADPVDESTAVVPDVTRTEAAELAWSHAELPEPRIRRPLPRSLRLLLGAVGVGALVVTSFILGERHQATRQQPIASSATTNTPAGPTLTGTYRLDYHPEEASYRGHSNLPTEQPRPSYSTWWAFRSMCSATGCTANGVRLDDVNHGVARVPALTDTLHFVNGQWRDAVPTIETGAHRCLTHTEQWGFWPLADGSLRGSIVYTISTDECGTQGNTMEIPISVARLGPVPEGVLNDGNATSKPGK